MLIQIQNTEY